MFRRDRALEGPEDKNSVSRIDPRNCGWYVQPVSLRPELASETAWMLDCFQQLRIRRAIAKKNRNLVGHGFFRVGQFIRQDRQSLGDGI